MLITHHLWIDAGISPIIYKFYCLRMRFMICGCMIYTFVHIYKYTRKLLPVESLS